MTETLNLNMSAWVGAGREEGPKTREGVGPQNPVAGKKSPQTQVQLTHLPRLGRLRGLQRLASPRPSLQLQLRRLPGSRGNQARGTLKP